MKYHINVWCGCVWDYVLQYTIIEKYNEIFGNLRDQSQEAPESNIWWGVSEVNYYQKHTRIDKECEFSVRDTEIHQLNLGKEVHDVLEGGDIHVKYKKPNLEKFRTKAFKIHIIRSLQY